MLRDASLGFCAFKAVSGRVRNTSWDLLVERVSDSSCTCYSAFSMRLRGTPGNQSSMPVPNGGSCSNRVHDNMDRIEYFSKNT